MRIAIRKKRIAGRARWRGPGVAGTLEFLGFLGLVAMAPGALGQPGLSPAAPPTSPAAPAGLTPARSAPRQADQAQRTMQPAAPMTQDSTTLQLRDMRRVEPIYGDNNPLSTPGRQFGATLNVPNDFGGVYQIPKDANTPYAGWYARNHGGVIAVFPQGSYSKDKDNNTFAEVPANTRYLLGGIPLHRPGQHSPASMQIEMPNHGEPMGMSIDTRLPPGGMVVYGRTGGPEVETVEEPAAGQMPPEQRLLKLLDDPNYRARRVGTLMQATARYIDRTAPPFVEQGAANSQGNEPEHSASKPGGSKPQKPAESVPK